MQQNGRFSLKRLILRLILGIMTAIFTVAAYSIWEICF